MSHFPNPYRGWICTAWHHGHLIPGIELLLLAGREPILCRTSLQLQNRLHVFPVHLGYSGAFLARPPKASQQNGSNPVPPYATRPPPCQMCRAIVRALRQLPSTNAAHCSIILMICHLFRMQCLPPTSPPSSAASPNTSRSFSFPLQIRRIEDYFCWCRNWNGCNPPKTKLLASSDKDWFKNQ